MEPDWHERVPFEADPTMEQLGSEVAIDAMRYAPKRTGALARSIEHHLEGHTVVISASGGDGGRVYAAYVELGHHGIDPSIVATQLPEDADKDGTPADWVTKRQGFATVAVLGGSPSPDLPISHAVFQVDCWATVPGSNKPPWGVANRLAAQIVAACLDRVAMRRKLTITVRGVLYPPAAVQGATAMTVPRRMVDDVGDYARYQFDLALSWTWLGQVSN
jgi:hypothetical protein